MKKTFDDYYLGLDMGTNSVGWAVTNSEYQVLKFNGKRMMGVHLFDEGKTAEERRTFRSARRRLNRRNNRIKLLKEIFAEEIYKVDPGFYQRMEDSFFYPEDKRVSQTYSLFNDPNFTDSDYNKAYPTIYHLRKALIESDEKFDIRLIYLAIHHILKNRGHFLFDGKTLSIGSNLEDLLKDTNQLIEENFILGEEASLIPEEKFSDLLEVLKNKKLTLRDKENQIVGILDIDKKSKTNLIIKLMAGAKVDLNKIFPEDLEDESISIKYPKDLEEILADKDSLTDSMVAFLENTKAIFDTIQLTELMQGQEYISMAKVQAFETHKKDLEILKRVIRKYFDQKTYNEFFKDPSKNYSNFVGMSSKKSKIEKKTVDQDQLNASILKLLKSLDEGLVEKDEDLAYLRERAELNLLFPKQKVKENATIPHQIHRRELEAILKKAEKHYDFLRTKDQTGYSGSEKILSIFEFRIPYYVGPLNDSHRVEDGGYAWIKKRSNEKIYPWNFNEVVDQEESAKAFIENMKSTCTYLLGEDVLAKNSLLYEEFTVLNEINNIRINGDRLSAELKNKIYRELFIDQYIPNLTMDEFRSYLETNNIIDKKAEISGIDLKINSSLKTFHAFKKQIGDKVYNTQMIEDIIMWAALFNDAKHMLRNKIKEEYGDQLTDQEINRILKINIKDWGRLSRKLLEGLVVQGANNGLENLSIIEAMRQNSLNFMELLSRSYKYGELIEEENAKLAKKMTIEEMVDESYVSPAVKRSINRTLAIVKEIEKITGKPPAKIFLEMARGPEEIRKDEDKRKKSRKEELLNIYKSINEDQKHWTDEIEGFSEDQFRSKKIYLYYSQMGRCMYSGEKIDLDQLFNKNLYDIDHIYPRSKVTDDSIRNNLVLVKKELNNKKTDIYPLEKALGPISPSVYGLWRTLLERELIEKEKYKRLIRKTEFTADELAGFINRQLVETRQSTKEIGRIFQTAFKDSDIVYTKARNVSNFRNLDQVKLLKIRELNDLHHAEDAYLNIVVGNVYDTKFTKDPRNLIKNPREREYNLNTLFKYKVERGGKVAWDPETSLKTVKKEMKARDVQFTRYSYIEKGQLFDANILSKEAASKGTGYFPLKKSDPRFSDFSKYGGYSKTKISYYCVVDHKNKNKIVRSIEPVAVWAKDKIKTKKDLESYLQDQGLEEPKVIVEKLKVKSLLKVDGFYYHITGKSGGTYVASPGIQLIVGDREKSIVKNLVNIKMKNLEEANAKDLVSEEDLIYLYDYFINKNKTTIYKNRKNSIVSTLEKGRNKFLKLEYLERVGLLLTILGSFGTVNGTFNLKDIGGVGQAGKVNLPRNLNNLYEFKIINRSVTGLFEEEIDLLGDLQ